MKKKKTKKKKNITAKSENKSDLNSSIGFTATECSGDGNAAARWYTAVTAAIPAADSAARSALSTWAKSKQLAAGTAATELHAQSAATVANESTQA